MTDGPMEPEEEATARWWHHTHTSARRTGEGKRRDHASDGGRLSWSPPTDPSILISSQILLVSLHPLPTRQTREAIIRASRGYFPPLDLLPSPGP
jgi:hypothetical protein